VLQEVGFEVRDVESLREHYAATLRAWVANLEENWDEAVAAVGLSRARIWRLYMAGCAVNFEEGRTMIHQVLGVRQGARGRSGMAPTRRGWYRSSSARTFDGALAAYAEPADGAVRVNAYERTVGGGPSGEAAHSA
jgi:cyclopropane-fatty-acyl-phospholipid synthase